MIVSNSILWTVLTLPLCAPQCNPLLSKNLNTLGPNYNEFGYNEHPVTTSK